VLCHNPNYPEPECRRGTVVEITGGRFSPPRVDRRPLPLTLFPSPRWHVVPRPRRHPLAPCPVAGLAGPTTARARVRAFGWVKIPPPVRLNRETFFFFLFSLFLT
jgi:hypothetical protein